MVSGLVIFPADATYAAGRYGARGRTFALKRPFILGLKERFFDAVIDKVPGEQFVQ